MRCMRLNAIHGTCMQKFTTHVNSLCQLQHTPTHPRQVLQFNKHEFHLIQSNKMRCMRFKGIHLTFMQQFTTHVSALCKLQGTPHLLRRPSDYHDFKTSFENKRTISVIFNKRVGFIAVGVGVNVAAANADTCRQCCPYQCQCLSPMPVANVACRCQRLSLPLPLLAAASANACRYACYNMLASPRKRI